MADNIDDDGYDDMNRAFLQAFMARASMTVEEATNVLAAIFSVNASRPVDPDQVAQEDLDLYINRANDAISACDLEIRNTLRQTTAVENGTPERVYALVNTTDDPLTQLATTYTADEIAFIKRVLNAMFDTYNTRRLEAMVITGMQAMQLAKGTSDASRRQSGNATQQSQGGASQSLSMSQAEATMKHLVDEGWFEKSRKGFYSLSPRGLMELRGYLVETYNGEDDDGRWVNKIKYCAACGDIVTVGQRCGDRDCGGRLHDICTRNYFRMQQGEKCPVCGKAWPGDKFVGERAITSTEQYQQGKRRSTNTQRRGNGGPSTQVMSQNGVGSVGEDSG